MNYNKENLNQILINYKIKAKCVDIKQSDNIVIFYLELGTGEKISKIKKIETELGFLLNIPAIPIIKLIPDKKLIAIEFILNNVKVDLLELHSKYGIPNDKKIPFLLGQDVNFNPIWIDWVDNPHLLIGGATGTGKSVLLHNLIFNILKLNNVELYLTDTKLVEFELYQNLPQICNIAQNYNECISVINKLEKLMEERFSYLRKKNISSIEMNPLLFNKCFFILDEAADIILNDKNKLFENNLVKLASKCRAAGIYLIIATQRPSSDILTGLIKNNFSGRIACKTSSKTDSQIILDQSGAEELVGKGQAIFKNSITGLIKFQIGYIEPKDIIKKYE